MGRGSDERGEEGQVRRWLVERARRSVLQELNVLVKLVLVCALGLVFFVDSLQKVAWFAFFIALVCIAGKFNPFASKLRGFVVLITVAGLMLYELDNFIREGLGASDQAVLFGLKAGLVAIVAFVAGDIVRDKEWATLLPPSLRPIALVIHNARFTLERVYRDAALTRRLRGMRVGWWLLRHPDDYFSAVLVPLVSAAEALNTNMVDNFHQRGYLAVSFGGLDRGGFGAADYLALILSFALVALSVI